MAVVCKVCGKGFKRLTNSHLRLHGQTLESYNATHEPQKVALASTVQFISEHYITNRSRWVEYRDGKVYTVSKRAWKLNDRDILGHLEGKKTIGLYFPEKVSKFIGLDVDSLDVELLNKAYHAVLSYGVSPDNILTSFSGSKGYHLDIFLSKPTDKVVIRKFHKTLLQDIGATEKQVELRGGGGQAYKLPLGYHQKSGNFCYLCDEWGVQVSADHLANIRKLSPEVIHDAVDINYVENPNADLMIEHEELNGQIQLLEIHGRTNELNIKQVERLIDRGVQEVGRRHIATRTVAAYCKDVKGYCLAETVDFLEKWICENWNKALANSQMLRSAKQTARSVYGTGFKFRVHANTISVSLPEIREVFSLDTGKKLQTEALRRLYYIFLLHSKAYAGSDGVFYMSYSQIHAMGGSRDKGQVVNQIKKLESLGKIMVVERDQNAGKGSHSKKFKRPNKYKLVAFETYEKEIPGGFHVCGKSKKCKDCHLNALLFLADKSERKKHIRGNRLKYLPKCEHN